MSDRKDNLFYGGDLPEESTREKWFKGEQAKEQKTGGCGCQIDGGCDKEDCTCKCDSCTEEDCSCECHLKMHNVDANDETNNANDETKVDANDANNDAANITGGCGCSLFGNSEYLNEEVKGSAEPNASGAVLAGAAGVCAYITNNICSLFYVIIIVLALIVIYLIYNNKPTYACRRRINRDGFYVSNKPTFEDLIQNEKELTESVDINNMLTKQHSRYYTPKVNSDDFLLNRDLSMSYVPIY